MTPTAATSTQDAPANWWVWPTVLAGLAVLCFGVARLFEPHADEFCYVLGHPSLVVRVSSRP